LEEVSKRNLHLSSKPLRKSKVIQTVEDTFNNVTILENVPDTHENSFSSDEEPKSKPKPGSNPKPKGK